jgi:hypothetical protein
MAEVSFGAAAARWPSVTARSQVIAQLAATSVPIVSC